MGGAIKSKSYGVNAGLRPKAEHRDHPCPGAGGGGTVDGFSSSAKSTFALAPSFCSIHESDDNPTAHTGESDHHLVCGFKANPEKHPDRHTQK